MFLRNHTKDSFHQPGTLRVLIVFGESHQTSKDAFRIHKFTSYQNNQNPQVSKDFWQKSKPVSASRRKAGRIDIQVCLDSSTVRALYEGLLVALWTTAQKRPQQRWCCLAQLALILVFFATLTIVGRCYASTDDDAAPLDQFHHPRLQNNSINPFSNLVLNRLFIPKSFVKSDIRLIRDKNHNHDKELLKRYLRIKREFENTVHGSDGITVLKNFKLPSVSATNFRNNVGVKELSVIGNFSEGIGAGNSSNSSRNKVTVNETVDEDVHQNDSHFQDVPHIEEELLGTTVRSMPPSHAHDNESGNLT